MKNITKKKKYLVIITVVILFALVSSLSMMSIHQLQGNARVVNYLGIVRGATQKLVNEEMAGLADDHLIERLSSIVYNLQTGEGPHNLVLLQDDSYLEHMDLILNHWKELQDEIVSVRHGGDPQRLFDSSQYYFDLVNETVFAAEAYSEAKVSKTMSLIVGINVSFLSIILICAFFIVRSITISRRANTLGKIAYVDRMTQLDNRASCDRLIDKICASPTLEDIAVIMFDMNGLKNVNDTLGHQAGDSMIMQFSNILKRVAKQYGFICRYGGDEFVAILDRANAPVVAELIDRVDTEVGKHNKQITNSIELLSFASGFFVGNLIETGINDMISKADGFMLENKRKMKNTVQEVS